LEAQNTRQRELLIDRELEVDVVKAINSTNGRCAGSSDTGEIHISRGVPQRRACTLKGGVLVCINKRRMPVKNAPVMEAMQRRSGQYTCFGFGRIRMFMDREGVQVVHQQRCSSRWREEGLQMLGTRSAAA